jgi:hypothetical protein
MVVAAYKAQSGTMAIKVDKVSRWTRLVGESWVVGRGSWVVGRGHYGGLDLPLDPIDACDITPRPWCLWTVGTFPSANATEPVQPRQ